MAKGCKKKVKHFVRIWDYSKETILEIIYEGLEIKKFFKKNKIERINLLNGKILGLIFEKPSTRTRVSFETAMMRLGGNTIFLSSRDLQLARGEPIKDTARVLSGYLNALVLRTYKQKTIEEFARYASIPVINGLSDKFHPCQILSDFMTILEAGKDPYTQGVVWFGDGNNMANSWIELAALLGFPLKVVCPENYEPDKALLKKAKEKFSARIEICHSPEEGLKNADIINTDVWTSMGQEKEEEQRKSAFQNFQLNERLLSLAKKNCIVLHCLPAHRGEEITEDVLEGPNSVVWTQAENKMWLHMSLLKFLLT